MTNHLNITDYKTKKFNLPAKGLLILFFIVLGFGIWSDISDDFKMSKEIFRIVIFILIGLFIYTFFYQHRYLSSSRKGLIKIKDKSIAINDRTIFEIESNNIGSITIHLYGYYTHRLLIMVLNYSYMNRIKIITLDKQILKYNIIINDKNDIEYLYNNLLPYQEKVNLIYMRNDGILHEYYKKMNKRYKNIT